MNPKDIFSRNESQYGLPAGFLDGSWAVESGRGKHLLNKQSGAAGHFQFMPKTAAAYGLKNPNDLAESAAAAARLARDNMKALTRNGLKVTSGNLYLLHQQGMGAGPALLRAPGRLAIDVLTDLYGSAAKARLRITQNGGDPDGTAGAFANHVTSHYFNKSGQTPTAPFPIRRPAPAPASEPVIDAPSVIRARAIHTD